LWRQVPAQRTSRTSTSGVVSRVWMVKSDIVEPTGAGGIATRGYGKNDNQKPYSDPCFSAAPRVGHRVGQD
jgi:hypothetical protein